MRIPKSKSGLIKWAKDNIGAEISFVMKTTKEYNGDTFESSSDPMVRTISRVRSNSITFSNDSSLYTDTEDTTWGFMENGWVVRSNFSYELDNGTVNCTKELRYEIM